MLFPALSTSQVLVWCLDRTGAGRSVLAKSCVYAVVGFRPHGYGCYIGTTNCLHRRLREHIRDARAVLSGRLKDSRTHGILNGQAREGGTVVVVALEMLGRAATPQQICDAELAWMLAAMRNGVQPITTRCAVQMMRAPFWPNGDRLSALWQRSDRLVWPRTWLNVLQKGFANATAPGPDLDLPLLPNGNGNGHHAAPRKPIPRDRLRRKAPAAKPHALAPKARRLKGPSSHVRH